MRNLLTDEQFNALKRFEETTSDENTYDLDKEMLRELCDIGVIRHSSRGIYWLTKFGDALLEKSPAPEGDKPCA